MADPDADAQLLERIGGKYGEEGSDYGDIGNADEDALLEGFDDIDFGSVKHSSVYQEDMEELDHEPEEPDTDVLDLEAQDVELDYDVEDKSNLTAPNNSTVTSTTQPEIDLSLLNQSELEEHERNTDKFKNERETPASKTSHIPDSLDAVSVPVAVRNNRNNLRGGGQQRGRGRGGGNFGNRNNQTQRVRPDNKTVLINPHFKGHVKINNVNDARLAWDARHKINHNKSQGNHQVGRVIPFSQNDRKQSQSISPIPSWINNGGGMMQNMPTQYQPPAPVYQQSFQPPQVSSWNQYQANTFNQVPPQHVNNNQTVFMQPLPTTQQVFVNHPPPLFNQPPPQFNQPPVYHNAHSPVFPNQQYVVPSTTFNQPPDAGYHSGFVQQNPLPPATFNSQNNQFMTPPPLQLPPFNQPPNNRFVTASHQPNNQFRNQQRFVRPKDNFKMPFIPNLVKRKMDNNMDMRKKKRSVSSTNLHEVPTVETPDTTVREEKPQEDEDEETKAYRKKIEEQKRRRQQILEQKEQRRKLAAQQLQQAENGSTIVNLPVVTVALPVRLPQQQPNFSSPRNVTKTCQSVNAMPYKSSVVVVQQQVPQNVVGKQMFAKQTHGNNTIITTDSEESNYDIRPFLTNRKILAKDQSLVDTSIVVVSNLAAGTTDVKLRKMCQGIGEIKKLQMSPKERQATIQFNSVASAHAFFKKYQRTMLDLSMIQVTLKAMP